MDYIVMLIILIMSLIYLKYYFNKLAIPDLYLISNLLFFIIYNFIVCLRFSFQFDIFVIIFFNLYLFLSIFIVLFLLRILFKKQYYKLYFKNLLYQSQKINNYSLFFMTLIPIIFVLYYLFMYQLVFRIPDSLVASDQVNTYRIMMNSFILPLIYSLLIIYITKFFASGKKIHKIIYFILIISTLFYLLLYSRRQFVLGIILVVILLYLYKRKNLFSIKNIPIIIISFVIIVMASNLYQNIREPLMAFSATGHIELEKNILNYIFDFKASSKNINERLPIGYFAYIVVDNSINTQATPTKGEIFTKNILNTIPSVLLKNKKYFSEDEFISELLNIDSTDYPTNIGISFFIDFKYGALILLPVFLCVFMCFSALVIIKFYHNKFLYILLSGQLLFLLFNVESSTSAYFIFIRNIVILTCLWLLYLLIYESFKIIIKSTRNHES